MTSNDDRQWMMPNDDQNKGLRLVRDEEIEDGAEAHTADGESWSDAAEAQFQERASMKFIFERRAFRRFSLEDMGVSIERWDGRSDRRMTFGRVLDLSAGGIRLRTRQPGIRADQQIRVRLELPPICGISPFVSIAEGEAHPSRDWTGWLAVARVQKNADGTFDVGGRLVDMKAMDRGMLGLYLSTQPLAA